MASIQKHAESLFFSAFRRVLRYMVDYIAWSITFITLHQKDWQKHSYVALYSVSERAILHRLQVNQKLAKIMLCLDNDNAGIGSLTAPFVFTHRK